MVRERMMTMKDKDLEKLMTEDPAAEEAAAEEKEECAAEEKSEADELREALTKAEEALAAEKDQHLRLMAEYQNYRNRTTEEKKKIYGDAKADCIKELLTVADTFDRAMEAECSDETYKKGIEMIYSQLKKAFEKLGIEEISPLGEEFDPNLHNAIRQIEEGDFEENTVCEVYQKGYKLGDRLVRPAVVAVKA
jgi:molecular chaperone GrpE